MSIRLKDEAAVKAASATKLATARKIGNASFDGTADISLSAMGAVGLASPAFTGTPTAPTAATGTNTTQVATTAFVTTAVNNKTSVTGNAGTATKLQTARTINGTSFDGSANITTSNWGTSRTITIGKTAKSVNGSGNVSWNLGEILGRVSISSSGSANSGKYIKFGSVSLASAWTPCVGKFSVISNEANAVHGILAFYFRNGSDNTTTSIQLKWLSLSNNDYAERIHAVRTGNGAYDLYWYAKSTYESTVITMIDCANPENMTLANSGTYVESITSASVSSAPTIPSHTHNYAGSSSAGGSANSAVKLATARTINGTSFDGSANITTANWGTARNIYIADNSATNTGPAVSVNGSANATLKLPATIKATTFTGALSGNATTATTLQTARTINGTSFNGSANITTANWGTARTVTVGNTGKSVNGSGNVSWSLSEIGALPTAGGTMTGTINSSLSTGTWLAGNQGKALLNSTNTAGTFTTLIKSNSTNGYFGLSNYNSSFYLTYTAKTTVDAGTNQTTKAAVLLNESGNSTFPGTITVAGGLSSSVLNGTDKNMIKADEWQTYVGSTTSETRLQGEMVHLLGNMHTSKTIYFTEDRAFIKSNTWGINNNGDTTYSNLYIGPSSSGEARVCAWADSSALTYRPIRALQFNASGGSILNNNLTLAGNAVVMNGTNGSIGVASGYMVVRTNDTAGYVYLQGAEVRATKLNSTSNYTHFRCGALTSNGNITTSGDIKSGNVYMNGANSIRNDTRELYLAGTSTSYPSYLGSMGISSDSAGGRWYSEAIYNRKYTASANMHITSAGTVGYTSSARRYKLDIKDVEADKPELILDLVPKTWFDKTATEQYANYLTMKAKGRSVDLEHEDIPYMDRQNGLIAEDVEEAGLGQFVNYGDPDEDGNREVMGIQYDRLWTLLIPVVRKQKETIGELRETVNEQQAQINEQQTQIDELRTLVQKLIA